jgi:hypothetical protein
VLISEFLHTVHAFLNALGAISSTKNTFEELMLKRQGSLRIFDAAGWTDHITKVLPESWLRQPFERQETRRKLLHLWHQWQGSKADGLPRMIYMVERRPEQRVCHARSAVTCFHERLNEAHKPIHAMEAFDPRRDKPPLLAAIVICIVRTNVMDLACTLVSYQ